MKSKLEKNLVMSVFILFQKKNKEAPNSCLGGGLKCC